MSASMLGSSGRQLSARDLEAALAGRLFPSDLEDASARIGPLFDRIRDTRVFITGGTGFVGRWMIESLLASNRSLNLKIRVTLLTRDPEKFARRSPHIARADGIELIRGDILSFAFPPGRFDSVVHLASETNTQLTNPAPQVYYDVIVGGTRRVLDFAEGAQAASLLLVSSGAVYGQQPPSVDRLGEDDPFGPLAGRQVAAYGGAKRAAESLTHESGAQLGIRTIVARCFAFVGPYLPLDSGFAVGNFIRDALEGSEIVIRGDGTPRRTYLYASDMATWLWTIALAGRAGMPYNVGSDEAVSVAQLATLVVAASGANTGVRVLGEAGHVGVGSAYVPDISRVRTELGLSVSVGLQEALGRTIAWHRAFAGVPQGSLP